MLSFTLFLISGSVTDNLCGGHLVYIATPASRFPRIIFFSYECSQHSVFRDDFTTRTVSYEWLAPLSATVRMIVADEYISLFTTVTGMNPRSTSLRQVVADELSLRRDVYAGINIHTILKVVR